MSKMASTIADRIAHYRGFVMPPVSKSSLRCPLGAKSGSTLEKLATMKSNKVDSVAKVASKPTPFTTETDSSTEKNETAHVGNCEKSTKLVYGEATKICALLKPDILEDMDVCAKLIDDVRRVIFPSSFAKHTTQYRTTLLAMMWKTAILAVESMLIDQEDTKADKEMEKLWQLNFILLSIISESWSLSSSL
ncbi:hypothetical protein ACFX19_034669 [Malus domestica]